jgi:hypothetical protein
MASGRSARARKRRKKKKKKPRAVQAPSAASDAETRLLTLARELATPPLRVDLAAALHHLAAAHAPDAPLPRAVARAWIHGRADKTAALQLAWAREQVRLALEDILARAPRAGSLTGPAETRAWLLLAAAEAIAQEPEAAAADRLKTLLDLTRS